MTEILRPNFNFDPNKQRTLDYKSLPMADRKPDPNLSPEEYQQQLDEMHSKTQQMYMMCVTECVRGLHKPAQAVFSCGHCKEQDPVHPNGMIFTPFKYYLCNHCYDKHRVRKLDLAYKLIVDCHQCIKNEWERVKKIDPTKVRDFLKDGVY
jgi:hypothetical protein